MTNISDINKLREMTGLGLLICKKALEASNGDMELAVADLRKRSGVAVTRLRERSNNEGRIESYIHVGSKIGVMVEVNCETDFAANTDLFKTLCSDLCLQIAATNPTYLSRNDIPQEDIEKEKGIISAGLVNKSPQAIASIVDGKLQKYYSMFCLLDQRFVRCDEQSIQNLIDEVTAKIGEKITIKRFVRYQVGA